MGRQQRNGISTTVVAGRAAFRGARQHVMRVTALIVGPAGVAKITERLDRALARIVA